MRYHPSALALAQRLDLYLPIPGLAAAFLYLATLSHGLTAGPSTILTATAAGLIPPSGECHPLFAWLAHAVASCDFLALPTRLNSLSALCGILCAALFYRLVARTILFAAFEGETYDATACDATPASFQKPSPEEARHNQRLFWIAVTGGLTAALSLATTAPVWAAATRLDHSLFDLLLALVSLSFIGAARPTRCVPQLAASAFFFSLGLLESAVFILLLPCYAYALFRLWLPACRRARLSVGLALAILAGGAVMFLAFTQNADQQGASLTGLFRHYARSLPPTLSREFRSFFPSVGWLIPFLQVGLIAVLLLFGLRLLTRPKTADAAVALVLLTAAVIPGLLDIPGSPQSVFDPLFHLPVFACAVIALGTAAALTAALLAIEPEDTPPTDETRAARPQIARGVATLLLPLLLLLALATPIRIYPKVLAGRGEFADVAAQALLDTLKDATWIFSNGLLDDSLRVRAFMEGRHVVVVSLLRPDALSERKRLHAVIDANPQFAGLDRVRLQNALFVSPTRFVAEWLNADTNAAPRVAFLTAPDIWTPCGYRAVPEGLAFGGVRRGQKVDAHRIAAENQRFADRLAPLLSDEPLPSAALARLRDAVRTRLGLAENELGVLFEEAEDYEAAYRAYAEAVRIDPGNISAAINHYAVAVLQKIHPESHDLLRTRARNLICDSRRAQDSLTSILQRHGTIRLPEFYRQQAALRVAAGEQAVADERTRQAITLSQRAGAAALNEKGACFEQLGDTLQAEACYRAAAEQSPANAEAFAGLCRLAVGRRNLPEAERWMARALEAGLVAGERLRLTVDLALLKQDMPRAKALLKQGVSEFPEEPYYWDRMADLLLRQGESLTVEKILLPDMQKKLAPSDQYLVYAIRGVLLCRKGPESLREGRQLLAKALSLNASQPNVWKTLLTADMAIGDRALIESDARALLEHDPDHGLANYLMGSILLGQGRLKPAEDFLRRSIGNAPTAMACNDLAEALRQQKHAQEAEGFARKAVALDPSLTTALDTLACVLFDLGKNDESLSYAARAVAAQPKHAGYQLTLLRVLVTRADRDAVRQKLRELDAAKIAVPTQLRAGALAVR